MSDLHAPKRELFDLDAATNTDPKGFVRDVDRWALHDNALYMARPADHPRFGYLESLLIPHLDLRVNRFHFRDGHGGRFPGQDLYVDIALVDDDHTGGGTRRVWSTTDLYIDLVTYAAGRWEILDLEELGAALLAGYIDNHTTSRALTAAQRLVDGMLDHDTVESWLVSKGVDVQWADTVTPAPVQG